MSPTEQTGVQVQVFRCETLPGRSVAGGSGCRVVVMWGGVGVVGDGSGWRGRARMTCRLETGGQNGGGRPTVGGGLCYQKLRPLHSAAATRLPEVTLAVMTLTAGIQVWGRGGGLGGSGGPGGPGGGRGERGQRTEVSFSCRSSDVPSRDWVDRFQVSQRNQVSDTHTQRGTATP